MRAEPSPREYIKCAYALAAATTVTNSGVGFANAVFTLVSSGFDRVEIINI